MRLAALVGGEAHIVGPETTIGDVASLMMEVGESAVAVAEGGRLVGICTDRDLARAVAEDRPSTTVVTDVMTESPDTVSADTEVADAAAWILETGYRHLPVLDGGELLGIIDVRDMLWAFIPKT